MKLHECDYSKKIRRLGWSNRVFYLSLSLETTVKDEHLFLDSNDKKFLFSDKDFKADDWVYFEEPKKKIVKLYQFAVFSDGIWKNTNTYYENENEVLQTFDCIKVKKLDYTEFMVEV